MTYLIPESEIIAAYEARAPIAEIADLAGCSRNVIHRLLKEHGVTPHRKRLMKITDQEIAGLYATKSVATIARETGRNECTIYRALSRVGVIPTWSTHPKR